MQRADRMLAEGKDIAHVCRELGVSRFTYNRWRQQFGGLSPDRAKRFKDLDQEIATLRRLLAEAEAEAERAALDQARANRRPAPRDAADAPTQTGDRVPIGDPIEAVASARLSSLLEAIALVVEEDQTDERADEPADERAEEQAAQYGLIDPVAAADQGAESAD
jgi:putative transposase